MPGHDVMVIGASAGGVETLSGLVRALPADLPAAIFVVHHFPPHATSVLPAILSRAGSLPANHARNGEIFQHGQIYVAPPDHHLLVYRRSLRVVRGARENGHRPAVDPLFRSAAQAHGPRVVGVVLSGTLDDGTAGLMAVKRRGGIAVVQDPADALYPNMPQSAIDNVSVDFVLPLSRMASTLVDLACAPVAEEGGEAVSDEYEREDELVAMDPAVLNSDERDGDPSGFACPECGGALWELTDGELLRFRCRVGHAYSTDTLLAEQSDALEAALWTALRALEESAALSRRLVGRALHRGQPRIAERFDVQVKEAEERAMVIRRVLLEGNPMPGAPPDVVDQREGTKP